MKKERVSVSGLQNIAKLMEKGGISPNLKARVIRKAIEPIDKQKAISLKTINNVVNHIHKFDNNVGEFDAFARFINAAVKDAYNAGHADCMAMNVEVEALLKQQYKSRTEMTMPAVVAAVMEQQGQVKATLDLALVATVFDRCKIHYHVTDSDQGLLVHFELSQKEPSHG